MNKTAILGMVLLGGVGYLAASCGSDTKSTAGAGGDTNVGGQPNVGGQSNAGGSTSVTTGGGSTVAPHCDVGATEPERFDGGLVQIGGTDPSNSIDLDVGGFYDQGDYKGYCFTITDNKNNTPEGSNVFPPCGGNGAECFTKDSKLCIAASVGVASNTVWGVGAGCSLNEDQTTGKAGSPVSVSGATTLSIEIYGCSTPKQLRLQLSVDPPIYEADKELLHSGYYCADVTLSDPDAEGVRKGSIEIAKLREDCWTGTGLLFDPALTAKAIQLQVNAGTARTEYDFCVSKFGLN